MALEDHSQKGSNSASSSGGGGNIARSSKKQKPKKVPQRGLGVAQLEKIRLEEQQKKDAAAILPSPPSTILSPTKSQYLSVPFPGYHNPSNHSSSSSSSSSSIPFSSDHSSSSSMLRPPPFLQNVDGVNTNIAPFPNPIGWSPVPLQGNANGVPKLWSPCEYNLEKESSGVDPGLAFRSNLIVPYELNPIWPLPSLIQRAQQCQQTSSMVNASSTTSASSSSTQSSSVLNNFQMEPPSNQSYYGNYTSPWPEEEKMVGFKRPYPFSLDNPPGPLFDCKFPPLVRHPTSKSREQASHCNGGSIYCESGNPIFRDGLTLPTSVSELNSKRSNREIRGSNRDFLTLAPPTISKFKHISPSNLGYNNHEYPDFESPPYQVSREDLIVKQGPSQSNQQQPYFSFFPPAAKQIDQAASSSVSNYNDGEVGESIDLNLKL